MGVSDIERDLKFIRKTMESSSRYTNVPALGYLAVGALGLAGAIITYLYLKTEKITYMESITLDDMWMLVLIWGMVFVAAVGGVAVCSWRKARRHQIAAWNSLVARMLFSQIPLVAVTGVFTIAMAIEGYYDLIPGLWLGIYGTILYSFSYFTGVEHKIEGGLFMVFGVAALFAPGLVGLGLLGLGFGGIHIVAGIGRLIFGSKQGNA
jgi:hypothetical protein